MNRNLILMALSLMTWGAGEGMFFFFQPLYLQQLGADPLAIGGILGIGGLAMSIAHLPAGYLSDRIGRRPLIILAWFIAVIALWIMALAHSLPVFIIGSVFYNLTGFVVAPMNSYITAARGKLSVGRVLTLVSATYNVGAILGSLVGGWLGEHAGLRTNFLAAAWIVILSTLIILWISPQPVHKPEAGQERPGIRTLLNQRYLQFLFVIFVAVFSMYLSIPLSPNFLQNERGISLVQMGTLISLRGLGVVVLNLLLGRWNARLGFLICQIGMAIFTLLIWQGNGFGWYGVGYFFMGSYMTARAFATAQGRTLAKAAQMGMAYGMIETVAALAIILAPPLAGFLYEQEPTWIYSVSLALMGFAFINMLFFSPIKMKDMNVKEEEPEWTPS